MIDACSLEPKRLLSISEAMAQINKAIQPITATESLTLPEALGRVSAITLAAPINLPYQRNAAMDGYALASADCQSNDAFTLKLVGTSWAGQPFQGELQAGQCIRIFTGAVLPESADSVVMQEHVQVNGQDIHFPAKLKTGQNVRAAGEDVQQGDCLLKSGKKLSAGDLGLLASAGIDRVTVYRRLKIACFNTGNELTALGQPLESGKIYDSNRYLLSALLQDPCYDLVRFQALRDDPQQLTTQFLAAAEDCDVILTTGGASVGDADYISDILASCGTINFWKIAIKPGKPLAFGSIGDCYFFGLPGNPIAVLTTFKQIVSAALRQLSNAPAVKPLRLQATLLNPLKKATGREEFQRGVLSQDGDGHFWATPLPKQGSHILSSLSEANCFIVLPSQCGNLQSGDTVLVEPFELLI